MLLSFVELVTYAIERLAVAFLIIFAIIALGAVRCQGQVVIFAGQPTLAPHDCYCGQSCKCDPCECNVAKAPVVSVKKPAKTTPDKSSVKVEVSRNGVASVASGTVIESDGSKSKVLTCWHLFRDPGDLAVYVGDKKVPAKLLKSNSKLDLALLEFDGSHDFTPFSATESKRGVPVTAYGYEHAGELKAFPTRIVGYYNYPDARVAGKAQPGRSGGGLFNGNDELVGVCSAADKTLPESIYVSYPAVEMFLYGKPQIASKAIPVKQSTPAGWMQDPNCTTGQCPLIRKPR